MEVFFPIWNDAHETRRCGTSHARRPVVSEKRMGSFVSTSRATFDHVRE